MRPLIYAIAAFFLIQSAGSCAVPNQRVHIDPESDLTYVVMRDRKSVV